MVLLKLRAFRFSYCFTIGTQSVSRSEEGGGEKYTVPSMPMMNAGLAKV